MAVTSCEDDELDNSLTAPGFSFQENYCINRIAAATRPRVAVNSLSWRIEFFWYDGGCDRLRNSTIRHLCCHDFINSEWNQIVAWSRHALHALRPVSASHSRRSRSASFTVTKATCHPWYNVSRNFYVYPFFFKWAACLVMRRNRFSYAFRLLHTESKPLECVQLYFAAACADQASKTKKTKRRCHVIMDFTLFRWRQWCALCIRLRIVDVMRFIRRRLLPWHGVSLSVEFSGLNFIAIFIIWDLAPNSSAT